MRAGTMDRRVRIERKQAGVDDGYGGGEVTWVEFATVWAEVQDVLPSKSETQSDVIRTATRPARIRMRYLANITSDMRILLQKRFGDSALAFLFGCSRYLSLARRLGLLLLLS